MNIKKMNQSKGTIYIRDNAWYKQENVIKMGIAEFAKDRSNTYITGEVERGEYILVIEVPLEKMKMLDKFLKSYFKSYNIYKGGGTEFYDRCIVNLIEPYLQELNIDYKVLSKEEICLMNRCERVRNLPNINNVKKIINQIKIKNIIQKFQNKRKNTKNVNTEIIDLLLRQSISVKPNEQQEYILEMIEGFYSLYDIGKIVWPCGLGKALLSILIVNLLNFKSIVIGVPGNNLQKQIKNEIQKIFPNKNNILFVGGEIYDGVQMTTNKEQIKLFLNNNNNNEPKFIISTYHSCYLLVDEDINIDFKIGDEAHHLVGVEKEENKGFRLFHKIKSKKTLFMTATEKIIEKNTNLLKFSDLILYEHQKEIYNVVRSPKPKLILYIAPTGTGKTLTPLGLSSKYKIIFVCAARHVGLALARSAISINKKIAFAFGCSAAEDVR